MTNLECVNEVLRAVGLRTVAAVETTGSSDAAEAWRQLESTERRIQRRGWSYNRRYDVTLEADGDGKLPLPTIDGQIRILWIDAYGADAYRDVVQYGSFLYDRKNNTDVFDADIKVEYILRFELCSIPEHVQDYIVTQSAVNYARYLQANGRRTSELRLLMLEANKAKAQAFRMDTGVTDQNVSRDQNAQRVVARPFDSIASVWNG